MIGPNPNPPYWSAKEYIDKETHGIKASASQKVKDDYEAYFNTEQRIMGRKINYPNMKRPYKNGQVRLLTSETRNSPLAFTPLSASKKNAKLL